MAKVAAKKGAGAARVPEYELLIRGGINSTDERIDAELKSLALDRAMHPTGVVRVEINTNVGKKPHPHAVLDAGRHLDLQRAP